MKYKTEALAGWPRFTGESGVPGHLRQIAEAGARVIFKTAGGPNAANHVSVHGGTLRLPAPEARTGMGHESTFFSENGLPLVKDMAPRAHRARRDLHLCWFYRPRVS